MSVICVIWYKIFTVFQNYWGGAWEGLAPGLQTTLLFLNHPPSVRHWVANHPPISESLWMIVKICFNHESIGWGGGGII
jgi:hypothetical protein